MNITNTLLYRKNIFGYHEEMPMKKNFFLIFATLLLSLSLFTGCSKESADTYVGETITSMKNEKTDKFALILDEGIAESNENYVLQFPVELKSAYLDFLQESFKSVEFEVLKAKKSDDGTYNVKISFTPIDLSATTESANAASAEALDSADLTTEVTVLLEECTKAVQDNPKYDEKILALLKVTETENGFAISDDDLKNFLEQVFLGYMDPYNTICDLLDAHDFMQAYLDAAFKGDVTQFAKHTDFTEKEAKAWYEDDVFDPPSDLTSKYADRYKTALKKLMKGSKYTVGIPKKEPGIYNYTIDITYTPNKSFTAIINELENGTYYSTEAVSRSLVEKMEKYAKAPVYGDKTTKTIPLNLTSLTTSNEYEKLALEIFPIPE